MVEESIHFPRRTPTLPRYLDEILLSRHVTGEARAQGLADLLESLVIGNGVVKVGIL